MNELHVGDLLRDINTDELILLLKKRDYYHTEEDGDIWEFWNLTTGRHSWWYQVHLEDERDFKRI